MHTCTLCTGHVWKSVIAREKAIICLLVRNSFPKPLYQLTPPPWQYICALQTAQSPGSLHPYTVHLCTPDSAVTGSLHPDSASVHPSAVYLQPLGSTFMSLRHGIHSPPAGIYSSVYPLWLLHSIFPSTHPCICTPWQCVHSIPSRVSHSPHQSWTCYLSFGLSLSFSNLCFVHILWTQALVWQIYPFLWCVFYSKLYLLISYQF